ncbi:hypothetical protein B0H10DRAFT_1957778 [Mycena sp. CBHHK59/15]|nr:hypothetical protein B0H10DRAFT_1957778 [Mycena sp. CBHHK59/15]
MLKSAYHLSSVCHLAVLRYILTHMVNAIALDVTDRDVCDQANSGMEVLEGLAWHGDVSHTNRLDAVQGVPSRSGVSFEGFGEMGGNRWEGNKTTNNTDSGTLTLPGESKACPLSVGRVQLEVLSACGRDKWKAATHAWVLESECASQAGMLSGTLSEVRVPGVVQIGRWAPGEQLQSRATCARLRVRGPGSCHAVGEWSGMRGVSVCESADGCKGQSKCRGGDASLLVEIHAQKAIEENRHEDEKSGRLEGTLGSASDDYIIIDNEKLRFPGTPSRTIAASDLGDYALRYPENFSVFDNVVRLKLSPVASPLPVTSESPLLVATCREAQRARLGQLEAEICHLQTRLDILTLEKLDIQSELEKIVYPILSIPNDITTLIFRHFVPTFDCVETRVGEGVLLLTGICRQWRELPLGMYELWSAADLFFKGT